MNPLILSKDEISKQKVESGDPNEKKKKGVVITLSLTMNEKRYTYQQCWSKKSQVEKTSLHVLLESISSKVYVHSDKDLS